MVITKHMQIKNYFIDKINREELAVGEKMPSEEELCQLFGVSRITVRQAFTNLENEGYIKKVHGKGSFVNANKTNMQLNSLQGFSEEMRSKGLVPSSKLISVNICPAGNDIAGLLGIKPDSKVYDILRIRCADDIEMAVENVRIPFTLCPGLEQYDLTGSLYELLLGKYGLCIMKATQKLQAESAEKFFANYLKIKPGSCVLKIERITYLNGGVPCEYVSSVYRGDKYCFEVEMDRK